MSIVFLGRQSTGELTHVTGQGSFVFGKEFIYVHVCALSLTVAALHSCPHS